jgi:hypothetical protein
LTRKKLETERRWLGYRLIYPGWTPEERQRNREIRVALRLLPEGRHFKTPEGVRVFDRADEIPDPIPENWKESR